MKFLLSFTLVCLCIFGYSSETVRRFIYFESNQSTLSPGATSLIDGMLADVLPRSIIKVEIYGYTDSDGDADANQRLSERRTASVKSYFISKAVEEKKIITESFGERNPAYSNNTEEGKRKNRRVEIAITYDEGPDQVLAPAVVEAPPVVHRAGSTLHQLPLTNTNVQVYKFSAKDEIEITGQQGTQIYFHPNSFRDEDGKAFAGEITFKLIEVYKRSEMINHQLNTMSNGKLLESGGMVYLEAFDKNKNLDLKSGWTYEITFPTSSKIPGMILFNGDTSGNTVNWQVQGSQMKPMFDYRDQYNQDQLNKYVFKSSSLGWINCDHFIGDKNLTSVFVDVDDTTGVHYCLVFKDINSVMNIGSREKGIEFQNVPEGRDVTVLVFRKTATATWFATKDITVRKNDHESLVLTKLTEAEFQERIKEFN